MIDLHCHILPEIDDGAESLEQSVAMIRIAQEEGIDTIAATHHFLDERQADTYLEAAAKQKARLSAFLQHEGINLEILPGAEVYISPFLIEIERLNELCINGSRYMLLELPMGDIPQYTEDVIYSLCVKGIIPIIAHPERNLRIIENPNLLFELIDLGALGQVNTGSTTGLFGSRVQKCARLLIEHGMVHVLGTDAHSDKTRAPRARESMALLEKWTGAEKVRELTEGIPRAIIEDRLIDLPQPKEYKKRRGLFSWFR